MTVTLRALEEADLDRVFDWSRDPGAVAMAAFTRADPSDRAAFDDHQRRIRADPDCLQLAVVDDGDLAGTIGSFTMDGEREVTYWIDPSRWGRGLASAALRAFVEVERTRPLTGRAAEHNVGSCRVLERTGFVRIGTDSGFAGGMGRDVTEAVYRLE